MMTFALGSKWSGTGAPVAAPEPSVAERGERISVAGRDTVAHAAMTHMGAQAIARFAAKGKYVFTTKAGEDYMKGVKTAGEDNVLRLVVTVS